MFELEATHLPSRRSQLPPSVLDEALCAQFVVAWAGEGGEEPRLGWWRSDLVSEYGGEDLFARLMPATWRWAVLQAVRETARRRDAELRRQDHDPDRIVSLYSLGFEFDERLEERLRDLKATGKSPTEALPGLSIITEGWRPATFWDWVGGHGTSDPVTAPVGRRLKGAVPSGLDHLVRKLVAGLAPAADAYPLPHFRRDA